MLLVHNVRGFDMEAPHAAPVSESPRRTDAPAAALHETESRARRHLWAACGPLWTPAAATSDRGSSCKICDCLRRRVSH